MESKDFIDICSKSNGTLFYNFENDICILTNIRGRIIFSASNLILSSIEKKDLIKLLSKYPILISEKEYSNKSKNLIGIKRSYEN